MIDKINSCVSLCKADLSFVSNILQRNLSPKHLIQKVFNDYGKKKVPPSLDDNEEPVFPRYYKLPFVGRYSSIAKDED